MGLTSGGGVNKQNFSPQRCPDGLAVVEFKPLELYIFTDVFASN